MASALLLLCAQASLGAAASAALAARRAGSSSRVWGRSSSLLQTWADASGSDTPVTRVVSLLKGMSATLAKEMDEDANLYKELACWCNSGQYEKSEAIKATSQKIQELEATIESLTAGSAGNANSIKELEGDLGSGKEALAEATALREKQLAEFHAMEVDSTQALENLKSALAVLAKHHEAPPESTAPGGAVFKSEQDSWSLLELDSKDFPWASDQVGGRSLDAFMRRNGFDEAGASSGRLAAPHKFLQQAAGEPAQAESSWSAADALAVRRALHSAAAFVQARHSAGYVPTYQAQSGEIVGVLQQLKEQMEGDLAEAQKREQARGAAFQELRAAKMAEIGDADKMAERKEDELAKSDNQLAEAKEDLGQEQKVLGEAQEFLKNLQEMCATGAVNFDERKKARLAEIQAVSETIEILQGDEARDAMSSTFKGFLQLASSRQSIRRQAAAGKLRRAARRAHNPVLSMLATSVELDAFTKVKKAVGDMITMLKQQQEDEVKKNDWCKAEIQENEMTTAKTGDRRADLEARIAELVSTVKTLGDEIADAQAQIAQQQLDLQRATEDRQKENLDFQRTVADQTVTVEVLKKALDRLATYYDLLQRRAKGRVGQTPPVPQAEYKPNQGAGGVMSMIEKLISDAKGLTADARKSESAAQAAYEQTVADTNGSVGALQQEVVSKTEARGVADRDRLTAESDLAATVTELEGLAKYNAQLHGDCDYVLKNFNARQKGRAEEVEALQQAMQILSGAELS